MAEEMQTVEQTLANLEEYRSQRQAVRDLLQVEPGNEEYLEMARSLDEVIELTEDLLRATQEASAQQPAPQLPIGSACDAIYAEDMKWYPAKIAGYAEDGYHIIFDGFEEVVQVSPHEVREQQEAVEVYQGVAAPKRLKVAEDVLPTEIPKKMQITDDDDEATRDRKRKMIKAFKSKVRLQKMDQATNERQNSWQSFTAGKQKSKKKALGFTDKKKRSMFATAVEGKVGVTGSGKGMTNFTDRTRQDRIL